jgi:hypothetical protein
LSTGDPNNPDPVELPTLKQILVLPIVRRNLARRYRLDREHDIPYLAGYSWDASVIFIDRDMSEEMTSFSKVSWLTACGISIWSMAAWG